MRGASRARLEAPTEASDDEGDPEQGPQTQPLAEDEEAGQGRHAGL